TSGNVLMLRNDRTGSAFEMQPGKITRPTTDEWLRKSQEHHQQAGKNGIEERFDARAHHIRERDTKGAAEHQIRHDPQRWNKHARAEKKDGEREPFDTAEISCHFRLRGGIDRLEKSVCENSVINNRATKEPTETWRAVNLSAPFRSSSWPEKYEMLETQQRFGFAITFLLFAKPTQGKTTVVPDDGSRTECDYAPGLLQPPAKIYVITRRVIFRIETPDIFESPPPKRHVTTRNVFGDDIGQQDVTRPAGGSGDTSLDPCFCRRRNIWTTHAREVAAGQRADQIIKPIEVGHTVRIGVSEYFAACGGSAGVARNTQPAIELMNVTHIWEFSRHLRGVIGRSIIHQDNLKLRVIDFAERLEARPQCCAGVVRTNDD